MRTIMLNSGANLLNQQTTGVAKLFITKFQAGDSPATQKQIESWDVAEPLLSVMQGNVVADLDATNIKFTNNGNDDKAKLACIISQTLPQMTIGNIVLFAGFDPAGSDMLPFCFCADDFTVVKLQSTPESPGYDFISNIMLDIYSLSDRFDFSNLQTVLPEFLQVSNETYLPVPFHDDHDQFIINDHLEYGGMHFVLNSHNIYFANPLMQQLTQTQNGYVLAGGIVGDRK